MNQEIFDFIKSQRVCVLAVEMMDGSPHGATLHFANSEDPLMFFFETDRAYRKCEPLFGKDISRASLVIGTTEMKEQKTLQLDGEVRLMTEQEKKDLNEGIYLEKFPEKKAKAQRPTVVNFLFIPTWWRFTDWTKPQGKVILSSEDK